MSSKEAIAFDEDELLELEMILIDEDAEAALDFLKRGVWKKIELARRGRLKSHLDAGQDDVVKEYHQQQDERG